MNQARIKKRGCVSVIGGLTGIPKFKAFCRLDGEPKITKMHHLTPGRLCHTLLRKQSYHFYFSDRDGRLRTTG